MSTYPTPEVLSLVKELVCKITSFKEGSNVFNHVETYILNHIQRADSMVFLTKKDIDRSIESLSDKFSFHGFSEQADNLRRNYENFIPNSTPKHECETRLNVMKFLLCLSESPTNHFLHNPEKAPIIHHEDEIDWSAYLKEGIERWSPPQSDLSEIWSDDSKSDVSLSESTDAVDVATKIVAIEEIDIKEENKLSYSELQKSLFDSIQTSWFNKEQIYMVPESKNIDANIAIHWDNYLEHSVQGLINLERCSIISEYCVIREILWQCWIPHNGSVFHFVGNKLLPKENVTISSVRPVVCSAYLHEFLPYIELLEEFRDFDKLVSQNHAPDTYRSYNSSIWNFLNPLHRDLANLEQEIIKQESTITLIKLANRFKELFKTTNILKEIHESVIVDVRKNDPITCANTLLSHLYGGLVHCVSKTELDIYLTLYLESLYKYFRIIDIWLSNDIIMDEFGEFLIKNVDDSEIDLDTVDSSSIMQTLENSTNYDLSEMGYTVKELEEFCKEDDMFKIICSDVLQIGKNIHFLRLLRKLYLLGDASDIVSLHDELINRVVKEISAYFHYEEEVQNDSDTVDDGPKYKFPAICPDYCKYPTEMDRIENVVDTTDGLLVAAFENYLVEPSKTNLGKGETLYNRISQISNNMYPAKQIIERIFSQILQERYSESGLLVKNILVVDYQLKKHFNLLANLFLFKDDLIFPLYRRLFEQITHQQPFDNDIWLTTQLRDIMMDLYPEFFEKAFIKIDNSSQIKENPLLACEMIDVHYFIQWPVNFIIRNEHLCMYLELFHLILKIKWALYTLNHLYFYELERKPSKPKQSKIATYFLRRLNIFRFHLLNEFSNIQHYILGYVFNKHMEKFQEDFERANNLDLLLTSHSTFINSLYSTLIDLRDFNKTHGFNMLLYIVSKLQIMWQKPKEVSEQKLSQYETTFKECVSNLESLIFPKDMIDV